MGKGTDLTVELHAHTHFSDGELGVLKFLKYMNRQGLDYVAITDHDTTVGWRPETLAQYPGIKVAPVEPGIVRVNGIKVIQGIEVTACADETDDPIHVVGLFLDKPAVFEDHEKYSFHGRKDRVGQMIRNAQQDHPEFSMDDISRTINFPPQCMLGIFHVAFAFNRYFALNYGRPYGTITKVIKDLFGTGGKYYVRYVEESLMPVDHAVEYIMRAGGLPVFAHPPEIPELETLVEKMFAKSAGTLGVEIEHPRVKAVTKPRLRRLKKALDFWESYGNDFHCRNNAHTQDKFGKDRSQLGTIVSEVYMQNLFEMARRQKQTAASK